MVDVMQFGNGNNAQVHDGGPTDPAINLQPHGLGSVDEHLGLESNAISKPDMQEVFFSLGDELNDGKLLESRTTVTGHERKKP
jgi:hypothetical protein